MITADIIFLIAMLIALALGAFLGFGKVFCIILKGKLGFVLALYIAYLLTNVLYNIPFIHDFGVSIVNGLTDNSNFFTNILLFIRIDFIIIFLIVAVICVILKLIFAKTIQAVFEMDNKVMKVINRVTGSLTMFAYAFTLTLIVFQIIYVANGGVEGSYYQSLNGSFFRLNELFANNPLAAFHLF